MKSLADLVREHRASLGLNAAEYARLVGTSRQNINNVEAGEAEQPRYIGKLAKAMGRTVDELLRGKGAPAAHLAMQDAGRYITPAQALPVALGAIATAPADIQSELAQVLGLLATTGSASYAQRVTDLLLRPQAVSKVPLDSSALSSADAVAASAQGAVNVRRFEQQARRGTASEPGGLVKTAKQKQLAKKRHPVEADDASGS